jgi:hypothetical protein
MFLHNFDAFTNFKLMKVFLGLQIFLFVMSIISHVLANDDSSNSTSKTAKKGRSKFSLRAIYWIMDNVINL